MSSKSARIFLSPPDIGPDEKRFVDEAFAENWVAPAGPHLAAFEREICAAFGLRHAVSLSSGTAALHLAARMVGVRPGDEVLCSTFTFVASANAFIYEGGRPVFIDSEEESWNMNPELLGEILARRARAGRLPRAVFITDIFGQCADWKTIEPMCARYGVPIVEDAAEAVGATCGERFAGSFGLIGVFSFNGNKILTTSGGGMLISNHQSIVDHAHKVATQARDVAPHYQHSELGYNYRLSNVLAGIGRGQLMWLEKRILRRREIFENYKRELGRLPGVGFMPEAPWGRCTRWLTCMTIDPDVARVDRESVRRALEDADIEARPLWKPLHLQPYFSGCEFLGNGVSVRLFDQGLCLPSGSSLTDEQQNRVVDIIRQKLTR